MTIQPKGPSVEVEPKDVRGLVLATAIAAGSYLVYRDHSSAHELTPGRAHARALLTGLTGGLLALTLTPFIRSMLVIPNQAADIHEQIAISNQAVESVESAIGDMDRTTSKLQKIAIGIGVGMALIGAIVGGFAGAWAATVIGK